MKKKIIKKEKGITLISLVVTIVILIILSTASINAILGKKGTLNQTKQLEDTRANEAVQENEEVGSLLIKQQELINTPEIPSTWDLSKVKPVLSEDNVLVPVPKGYTASTIEGEKSVKNGFVIKQGNDGNLTENVNEFVWVPVSNIYDMYDATNMAGQLWNFNEYTSTKRTYPTTLNSDFREPDAVTNANENSSSISGNNYDAILANLQQAGLSNTATATNFRRQLKAEFNDMIKSVKVYGGFYIGRYETGNLRENVAVVQKNNTDISNQTWYTMYKLSKTVAANQNVITSMIWGCQWDATLRWIQKNTKPQVSIFPTYSIGNYAEEANGPIPTGSNSAYVINNIYDMAGNMYEWTIEANGTYSRTERGGSYTSEIENNTASSRSNTCNPDNKTDSNGTRTMLYISNNNE